MENPAILLRRLSPYCVRAMEGAASLCQKHAHAEILPERWLLKLFEQGEGDLTVLACRYEWDRDAANLLKPALACGELRTSAATSGSEYKQYLERDAALVRRFRMVKVDEPDDDAACQLNQQILPVLIHIAVKQKPQSLCLSWSEAEGSGPEFDRTQGVNV